MNNPGFPQAHGGGSTRFIMEICEGFIGRERNSRQMAINVSCVFPRSKKNDDSLCDRLNANTQL